MKITRTERRWLEAVNRNPHSRSKRDMAERSKWCLASLRIAARRNKAAARAGR